MTAGQFQEETCPEAEMTAGQFQEETCPEAGGRHEDWNT